MQLFLPRAALRDENRARDVRTSADQHDESAWQRARDCDVHLERDIVFIANSARQGEGTGAVVFTHKHADLLRDAEFPPTEG